MTPPPSRLAGQLLVTGFAGKSPSPRFTAAVTRGERAGMVLFKRNGSTPFEFLELNRAASRLAPDDAPLLSCVDQEGGRVERIKEPFLTLPPMARLAKALRADQIRDVARAQAEELRALGFTLSFAPVLDINTEAQNPVIGDRAFGTTAEVVIQKGLAFAEGLRAGGILACGKHYPGHGDTTADSHVELPTVTRDRMALEAMDLLPFRAAARAGIDALMTAHVTYPALDPGVPATLSHAIATDVLRGHLGFKGALFSDDLEMRALSWDVEQTSVAAIMAGCDALLVCSDEDLADRAHAALTREIESSAAFCARATIAAERVRALRLRAPQAPSSREDFERIVRGHDAIRALVEGASRA